jgi:hypothetical protein
MCSGEIDAMIEIWGTTRAEKTGEAKDFFARCE